MKNSGIPEGTLMVGLGAALIFCLGLLGSYINESGRVSNEGTQVQPTPTVKNITQGQ